MLVVTSHADVRQILGSLAGRDHLLEGLGIRQISTTLPGDAAIAREHTRDLAGTISAKIEVDATVVIPDRRERLAAIVDADEWHHEFIGEAALVRVLHPTHRINVSTAFAFAFNHRVEGFALTLPALVAIHGVIASADAGYLADPEVTHLLLELLEVSRPAGGESIAAIHEGVDEHAIDSVLPGHAQQRIKMVLVGVHAPIGKQTEEVQPSSTCTSILHGRHQCRIGVEFSLLDHHVDFGDVHVHDAAGADVQMSNFAVAHLSGWQADVTPAGVHECAGKIPQQHVVIRLARERDGVGLGFGAVSPAIEDDEHQRGIFHRWAQQSRVSI